MTVETRYFRSDTELVNGLNTEKLRTTQSGVSGYRQILDPDPEGTATAMYWGIRVWKRSAAGVETEITAGTPVALVLRTANGSGMQSNVWSCPETALSLTDSIIVRVYESWWSRIGGFYAWSPFDTWQTEQLGAEKLDAATWTVNYYTWLSRTGPPWIGDVRFYFDDATYNSSIANFTWSPPAAILAVPMGDGLTWVS